MGLGVSTRDLRKVYTTPPPMALGAAGFSMMGARGGAKKAFEIGSILTGGIDADVEMCLGMLLVQ